MSSLFDWVRLLFAVLLLVVAHFVLRPLLGDRIEIDFLVLALLLLSMRVRPGVGALLGLVMGAAADAASPAGFGSAMLALLGFFFWLSDNFNVQPEIAVTRRHRCRKSGVKSPLIRATGEGKQDTPKLFRKSAFFERLSS